MATEVLGYLGFPRLAVAENATSPDPGIAGVIIWSTSVGRPMYWNGTNWVSVPAAAGGSSPVVISPASLSAAQTDYNPSGFSTATQVRLTSSANVDINSLATRSDGVEVTLTNIGTFTITLKDEMTTGTTAAQRFALNGDVAILPEASVRIIYDGTTARWRAAERPSRSILDLTTQTAPALDDKLVTTDTSAADTKILPIEDLTLGIGLRLHELSSDPAAPAGGVQVFSSLRASRPLVCAVPALGEARCLQPAFFGRRPPVVVGIASGTTAPTVLGATLTTAATMSLQFTAGSTNRWTSQVRKRHASSTTAGTATGVRQAYTQFYSGNAAGYGGVFAYFRVGHQTNTTGYQYFAGICASTGALAGDPSALTNMIGIGYDAADTSGGNWQLMRNDGSGTATRVDLGATNAARAADQGFDLYLFNPPNSTTWYVTIYNVNTGALVIDTSYTTDTPAVNTGLAWKAETRNGAIAAACTIEYVGIYLEPLGY